MAASAPVPSNSGARAEAAAWPVLFSQQKEQDGRRSFSQLLLGMGQECEPNHPWWCRRGSSSHTGCFAGVAVMQPPHHPQEGYPHTLASTYQPPRPPQRRAALDTSNLPTSSHATPRRAVPHAPSLCTSSPTPPPGGLSLTPPASAHQSPAPPQPGPVLDLCLEH